MHSLWYLLVLEEDTQPYHSKGPALGYKMEMLRDSGSGSGMEQGQALFVRERLRGGFLYAVSHKSSVPGNRNKWNDMPFLGLRS